MSIDSAGSGARLALTRAVSPRLADCELLHLERRPIDVALARRQQAAYEAALARLGCEVRRLAPLDDRPDGVFVEDTGVVLDEFALLCRPGAASRRPEVESVARALADVRPLARVEAPATLDGGDVLRVGRRLWIGRSARTNAAGARRLAELAEAAGYTTRSVPVERCLHLKSAATALDPETVLVDPRWVDAAHFAGCRVIPTDERETAAANALAIDGRAIYSEAFPRTAERIARAGFEVVPVEITEIAKAEGAVTCCSLIVDVSPAPPPGA